MVQNVGAEKTAGQSTPTTFERGATFIYHKVQAGDSYQSIAEDLTGLSGLYPEEQATLQTVVELLVAIYGPDNPQPGQTLKISQEQLKQLIDAENTPPTTDYPTDNLVEQPPVSDDPLDKFFSTAALHIDNTYEFADAAPEEEIDPFIALLSQESPPIDLSEAEAAFFSRHPELMESEPIDSNEAEAALLMEPEPIPVATENARNLNVTLESLGLERHFRGPLTKEEHDDLLSAHLTTRLRETYAYDRPEMRPEAFQEAYEEMAGLPQADEIPSAPLQLHNEEEEFVLYQGRTWRDIIGAYTPSTDPRIMQNIVILIADANGIPRSQITSLDQTPFDLLPEPDINSYASPAIPTKKLIIPAEIETTAQRTFFGNDFEETVKLITETLAIPYNPDTRYLVANFIVINNLDKSLDNRLDRIVLTNTQSYWLQTQALRSNQPEFAFSERDYEAIEDELVADATRLSSGTNESTLGGKTGSLHLKHLGAE